MRRVRGWGSMGVAPHERDAVLTRGRRTLALTHFSSRGFEDWRFTSRTFTMTKWQHATTEMLLTPDEHGDTLASKFTLLLLDNATIHKDSEYLRRLRRHINVHFIPPYCYHLSPLDNGAFGCARAILPLECPTLLSSHCCVICVRASCAVVIARRRGAHAAAVQRALQSDDDRGRAGRRLHARRRVDATARWCFHNCYSGIRTD